MNRIRIRTEKCEDYPIVENLTREAFWNVYRPGCMEHYVLHRYRSLPDFLPELSLVLELDGRIIGHIMYSRAKVQCDDGTVLPIAIFGPLSVHPNLQGRGYGSMLVRQSLDLAEKMGCGAVAITGSPAYYARFGFVEARSYGIYYAGMDRNDPAPFFMAKELKHGYLQGISGTYSDPEGYLVSDADVEAFDRRFPPKEKLKLPGQLA